MRIAGVVVSQSCLEPGAGLHRLIDQQAIHGLLYTSVDIRHAHPGVLGAGLGAQFHRYQDVRVVQVAAPEEWGAAEQGHFQLAFAQLRAQHRRCRSGIAQQRIAACLLHLLGGDMAYIKTDTHQRH